MSKEIHVWQLSPNPTPNYAAKKTAAHTIADALAVAADKDTIRIWGDGNPGQRLVYAENVKLDKHGLRLIGEHFPVIDGGRNDRTITCLENDDQLQTIWGLEVIKGFTAENGAGIYAKDSRVLISTCCIAHNRSKKSGGGICLEYTDKSRYRASFVDTCFIYDNRAINGGGIATIGRTFPSAGAPTSPVVTIMRNLIGPDNKSVPFDPSNDYTHGGGANVRSLPALLLGNEFWRNQCGPTPNRVTHIEAYGGALCVYDWDDTSTVAKAVFALSLIDKPWSDFAAKQVELIDNLFHGNTSNYKGGGLAAMWGGLVRLERNWFEDNTAGYNGGGAYTTTRGSLLFGSGNTLVNNHALGPPPDDGDGGGVHASCRARVQFVGPNVVKKNDAQRSGGGISVHHADLTTEGTLHVVNNEAGELGGGIHAIDTSVSKGLLDQQYVFCDQFLEVSIREAIIEENKAGKDGGGAALIQDISSLLTSCPPVKVERSIVRVNTSGGEVAGLLMRRTTDGDRGSPFHLTGCLIEKHTGGKTGGIGVSIEELLYGTSSVKSSVFAGNDVGLQLKGSDAAAVEGSRFDANKNFHLAASDGVAKCDISATMFDGAGVTRTGLRPRGSGLYSAKLTLAGNDVVNHTAYSVHCTGWWGGATCTGDWWGKPTGPPKTGPNRISSGVTVISPAGANLPLNVNPPNLAPPIVVKPPRPAVPDCKVPKPPDSPPFRPKEPPGLQTPDGSSEKPLGGAQDGMRMGNDDVLILDEDGRPRGVRVRDGAWYPAWETLDGLAPAPPEPTVEVTMDEPSPQPAMDQLREWLSSAQRMVKVTRSRSLSAGDRLADAQLRGRGNLDSGLELILQVDGWPLLTFTPSGPIDAAAFDWTGLRVFVDAEMTAVAIARGDLPTVWKLSVQLPLPRDRAALPPLDIGLADRITLVGRTTTPRPAPWSACKRLRLGRTSEARIVDVAPGVRALAIVLPPRRNATIHVRSKPRTKKTKSA